MKSIFIDILINRTGFNRFERLIVTGGASINHSILQIIADIFQTPVYTIDVKDSASIGAGIRASIGYLKQTKPDLSIEDFFNSISPNDILNLMNEPNKDVKNIYDNLLDVYSKIESSLYFCLFIVLHLDFQFAFPILVSLYKLFLQVILIN